MRKYLIVDGHNLFIRSLIAVPLLDANGEPVGGVVGTLRSITSIARTHRVTDVVVVWDGEGGSTKRRSLFSEYKSGRRVHLNRSYDFGESTDDHTKNFQKQRDLLVECLRLLGVPQVCVPGLEGDDVIAFLSVNVLQDEEKLIASADRDMLQLVDVRCSVYSPTKKQLYTRGSVLAGEGVRPENMVYYRALVGDGSDNIDGVKGVGPKKALAAYPELGTEPMDLQRFMSLLTERASGGKVQARVAESLDLVRRNVQLMQLSSPDISAQAARAIRVALAPRDPQGFNMRIFLARNGIQFDDTGVISLFKEIAMRRPTRAAEDGNETDE